MKMFLLNIGAPNPYVNDFEIYGGTACLGRWAADKSNGGGEKMMPWLFTVVILINSTKLS